MSRLGGTNERRHSRHWQTPHGNGVHRIATLLTSGSRESRELQESKARLEEAQRVAHVGYWVWNLETNR